MSDYSIETQVERDTFNPGEFTVDLALTAVDWLGGGVSDKSTSLKFKTGARMISLSEKLPNLAAFAVAEEIAKASMTGNTFLCSRLPGGTWDGQTGEWKTIIDAPVENIRSALNDFNGYLTVTDMEMRDSAEAPKLPKIVRSMSSTMSTRRKNIIKAPSQRTSTGYNRRPKQRKRLRALSC